MESLHFALYDAKRQLFVTARDRYGIKPLFWTFVNDKLLVAAEAKAFLPLGWKPEWDVRSVVEDGWLHDERSLFKGVNKVSYTSHAKRIGFAIRKVLIPRKDKTRPLYFCSSFGYMTHR